MSTVTLTIGPKSYTVACADGEEAHIAALGAMIAEKYAKLGTSRAPLEAQNLLFAALFLADELTEARKRLEETPQFSPTSPSADPADAEAVEALRSAIVALEADLAAAREAAMSPAPSPPAPQIDLFGEPVAASGALPDLADRLEALAARAEASAAELEAAISSA